MTITVGPYQYRPLKYDDWGTVRGKDGQIVCHARGGWYLTSEDEDKHRENKTDPYEDNARLFSASYELLELVKTIKKWIDLSNIDAPWAIKNELSHVIDKAEGRIK